MLLAVASLLILGPTPQAVRRELTASYGRLDKAFSAGDIVSIGHMLSDDFVLIQGGRIMRKRQMLAGLMTMMAKAGHSSWHRSITALKVGPTTVEATVVGRLATTNRPQNRRGPNRELTTSRDIWVSTPSGYRLKRSVVLKKEGTIERRPVVGRR